MIRKPRTHLKPRFAVTWPTKQPDGLEYIFDLGNRDTRGEPATTFIIEATFHITDAPVPIEQIPDPRVAALHTPSIFVQEVTLRPQEDVKLSIYARVLVQHPQPMALQLVVRVYRAPDTDQPVVTERGHNARLVVK